MSYMKIEEQYKSEQNGATIPFNSFERIQNNMPT